MRVILILSIFIIISYIETVKYRGYNQTRRSDIMFITEKLETKVYGEYDVIVVGAGPAGCAAAISAARNGMKTLIIDKFNCLGGMWTTGFMNPLFDYGNKGGILKELIDEHKEAKTWGGFWNMSFNYEYMKHFLDVKMKESGAEVLLNTYFAKTLVENKSVKGIIFENIEGRFAALSKVVIDASGDGNVAASAGCEFMIGEDGDYTKCQAMTLMFLVGNIPEKYKDGLMIFEKLDHAYKKAGKVLPFKVPYLIPVPNSKFGVVQFTHMYDYNPLSAKDITAATEEGRQQMLDAFTALKEYDEEFKDLDLISSSNVLGVRESRRIVGEYILTADDILNGRRFYDGIAEATFNVDIHTKDNKGQKTKGVQPYDIPFRCLIPKGFEGILTAGRCISGDQVAMASYRVTGNCCQMGEAAGKYAAQAIKNSISLRNVFAKQDS